MLTVGIPRERKRGEKRVALTPCGISKLTSKGIPVLVETRAGEPSGYTNAGYRNAGASIVRGTAALWNRATLIVKVKEPQPEEFRFLKRHHLLFSFLHLTSPANRRLAHVLRKTGLTAIAYELVVANGEAVILAPMSDFAGSLVGVLAGIFRWKARGVGRRVVYDPDCKVWIEKAVEQFPEPLREFPPGRVFIFGGGHVGFKAAEMCAQSGGEVTICERNPRRRKKIKNRFSRQKVKVRVVPARSIRKLMPILEECDCLVGSVYQRGFRAPLLLDRTLLRRISARKRKLIFDVSIDQGGNFYGSKLTDADRPLQVDRFGNLRFGVPNLPSFFGRRASEALEKVTWRYVLGLAERGLEGAFRRFPELSDAVVSRKGSDPFFEKGV